MHFFAIIVTLISFSLNFKYLFIRAIFCFVNALTITSEIVNVVISKIWNVEDSKVDVHYVKLTRAHVSHYFTTWNE